ncbi:MAG: copper resistance protein CopC [Acetobacteraceae bacterium]|nr:copper resistance protein CopC [Acetobacteraceae bacterium]
MPLRRMCAALIVAAFLVGPGPALAHAILVASQPRISGTVAPGPVSIEFRFNSRIDHARSRLSLVRPDHSQSVLPIVPDSAEDVLAASTELSPGAYTIKWQVLAVDGHITRGDVPFMVSDH